jgi:hypothetical protein
MGQRLACHAVKWSQTAAVLLAVASACWLQLPGALAAVPADLTNFQNEYPCDPNATLIVRYVLLQPSWCKRLASTLHAAAPG